jgi:hypothetical protein
MFPRRIDGQLQLTCLPHRGGRQPKQPGVPLRYFAMRNSRLRVWPKGPKVCSSLSGTSRFIPASGVRSQYEFADFGAWAFFTLRAMSGACGNGRPVSSINVPTGRPASLGGAEYPPEKSAGRPEPRASLA